MSLIKRVKVSFLTLFILFAEIAALPSKAALAQSQLSENHMKQQTEYLKTADNGITDSTGDYEYIILHDGTAEIVKYLKEEETVKIPSELDGHPVTVIGEEAFGYKLLIASIEIPDTITYIKKNAFSRTGIKEVIIPEGVLKIGKDAFWYCQNLERLYIPQNVEKIEGNIVWNSNKLTEIEVDARNAAYKSVDGVLYNKDVTKLLAMPGGKDMTGFQFPETVVHIGYLACAGTSFTELVIPDRVTTLESAAFHSCDNLKRVDMGENVTVIGSSAFSGCDSLSEVILNEKLKVIGEYAFCECYDLTRINISDGVIEIGKSAFENCGYLKNIMVPKSVTKIGRYALAYSEEGTAYENVCITGYKDTAAHRYAKRYHVTFRNAENGTVIRYDLIPVPKEKIEKLTAGIGKIKLVYKTVPDAVYRIAVKKAGAAGWKKYDVSKTSAVIKGLASGKQYKVKVRALHKIDGKYYYGKWSSVKKITVR